MKLLKSLLLSFLIASLLISPIEAKTPWTSKPFLGSQIDWSHPLSRGLVGVWLFNEQGGIVTRNLVKNKMSLLTSTIGKTPSWIPDGIYFPVDASNRPYINAGLENQAWTNGFSLVAAVKRYSNSNYQFIAINGDANSIAAGFSTNSSTPRFYFGGSATNAASDIIEGVWTTLVYTKSTSRKYIYINGRSALDMADVLTASPLATPFCFGRSLSYNDYPLYGSLKYVFIYNRGLSPSEAISITRDPYQIFKPQTDWNCIKAAVAGGINDVFGWYDGGSTIDLWGVID